MYRYTVALLVSALFLAGLTASAGDKPDGKELYRNNCKICHDKGSPHGQYSPLSLVQGQWERFFNTKLATSHKEVTLKDGKKLLDTLTPEQIKAIQKFCVDHAADSEQPATCG